MGALFVQIDGVWTEVQIVGPGGPPGIPGPKGDDGVTNVTVDADWDPATEKLPDGTPVGTRILKRI